MCERASRVFFFKRKIQIIIQLISKKKKIALVLKMHLTFSKCVLALSHWQKKSILNLVTMASTNPASNPGLKSALVGSAPIGSQRENLTRVNTLVYVTTLSVTCETS